MSERSNFNEVLSRIENSMKHVVERLQKLEDNQKKAHEEEKSW